MIKMVSASFADTIHSFRSCITRADFRLAKLEKRSLLSVNEHFESERNDKATLLDSFYHAYIYIYYKFNSFAKASIFASRAANVSSNLSTLSN